jgi:hypothetical protein
VDGEILGIVGILGTPDGVIPGIPVGAGTHLGILLGVIPGTPVGVGIHLGTHIHIGVLRGTPVGVWVGIARAGVIVPVAGMPGEEITAGKVITATDTIVVRDQVELLPVPEQEITEVVPIRAQEEVQIELYQEMILYPVPTDSLLHGDNSQRGQQVLHVVP